jgi:hypothetical protein
MRIEYATQFNIVAPPTEDLSHILDMLNSLVFDWIRGWYRKRKSLDVLLSGATHLSEPYPDHRIEIGFKSASSIGVFHNTVDWRYPDERDDNLLWNSHCEWASTGAEVEFSILVNIDSRSFKILPPHLTIKRPRIVCDLLSHLNCQSGGFSLSVLPTFISTLELDIFIQILLSNSRRLPIVLFSLDKFSERPLADPDLTQDLLAGLAHVFVLKDKWTSFALTEKIGRQFSCFGGAIRIYWPNLSLSNSPSDHPLILPQQIESFGGQSNNFPVELFNVIRPISTFRFVLGSITRSAAAIIEDEGKQELEALKEEARRNKDNDALLELADEEIRTLKTSSDVLKYQLRGLEDQNQILNQELAIAKQNIAAINAFKELPTSKTVPTSAQEETAIESIARAVMLARDRLSDTLIFLETAFESAADSPYDQPERAYEALEAMDEVCKLWRNSLHNKESIGSLEENFKRLGFAFKAHESDTSTTRWGGEYRAQYEGKSVPITSHLALGKGGPNSCLRIHFYMDKKKQKFVVAHVGRHKTNTST